MVVSFLKRFTTTDDLRRRKGGRNGGGCAEFFLGLKVNWRMKWRMSWAWQADPVQAMKIGGEHHEYKKVKHLGISLAGIASLAKVVAAGLNLAEVSYSSPQKSVGRKPALACARLPYCPQCKAREMAPWLICG